MATKMGFEGKIYYGVKGSTAATELTNSRDINETFDVDKGETTVRGAGTSPPIETNRVTKRKYSIEWTMLNKTTDSSLAALLVAAAAGTAVAIRTKSYSSGLGYDGDCNIAWKFGTPYLGEQTIQFTADPNAEDRDPQVNV